MVSKSMGGVDSTSPVGCAQRGAGLVQLSGVGEGWLHPTPRVPRWSEAIGS